MKTNFYNFKQTLKHTYASSKNKFITFIKNEKNDFTLSFIIGLTILITYSILNYSYVYSMTVKEDIANNVIRFHILANSDSKEDQALKIFVKDSILEEYKEDLTSLETREEAIDFFNSNMLEIENFAQNIVYQQGYTYDVNCELAYTDFPTKTYNDITLPKGEYLAFRVLIGDHAGQNFWCVLYPPLCYVDAVDQEEFNDAKLKLEDSLPNDEFLLISDDKTPEVFVKFKIVEMWEER